MAKQGDILLVPVPFTDLTSAKRRPVIVASNDDFNTGCPDMIVVAMTSNPRITPQSFLIDNSNLVDGTLNRPGYVRADKIFSLSQGLAVKRFGAVDNPVLDRIRRILDGLTSTTQQLRSTP